MSAGARPRGAAVGQTLGQVGRLALASLTGGLVGVGGLLLITSLWLPSRQLLRAASGSASWLAETYPVAFFGMLLGSASVLIWHAGRRRG